MVNKKGRNDVKVKESFNKIAKIKIAIDMKLSTKSKGKDKIISTIQKFFDIEKIEEIARATNFVQRKSKLDSVIFFSVCVCTSERSHTEFRRLLQRSV